jgi:TPR repeat protein
MNRCSVAVLIALVLLNVSCESQTPETDFEPEETNAPVQALTPLIDALRVRAEAGDAEAQFNLGVMSFTGTNVPEDDAEAVRSYRLAADQELASAQNALGVMCQNGEGVPQDDAEAVRWYWLAADQKLVTAQYRLGNMYANGEGVPQDDAEAERWYRLAADQGHDAEPPRLQRCRSAALHSLPAFGRGLLGGQV